MHREFRTEPTTPWNIAGVLAALLAAARRVCPEGSMVGYHRAVERDLGTLVCCVGAVSGCFTEPDGGSDGGAASAGPSSTADSTGIATSGSTGAGGSTDGGPGLDSTGSGATGPGPVTSSPTTADGTTTGPAACDCPYDGGHCLDDGQCARWVFVTSQTYTGEFQGLPPADDACAEAAQRGGLGGFAYRAFLALGGDATGALDRVGVRPDPPAVWITPDQTTGYRVVAESWDQLRFDENQQAQLSGPIDRDESGAALPAMPSPCGVASAWTGLDPNATNNDCSDWTTVLGRTPGSVGLTNMTDRRWASDQCNGDCEMDQLHLYCFEVPPPP